MIITAGQLGGQPCWSEPRTDSRYAQDDPARRQRDRPGRKASDVNFGTTTKWYGDLLIEEFVLWDSALQAQQIRLASPEGCRPARGVPRAEAAGWPGRAELQAVSWVVLLWTLAAASAEFAVYRMVLEPAFSSTYRTAVRWLGRGQASICGSEMAVASAAGGRLRHLAFFYHSRGEYLSALRGFIRASRARGEAVLVAVPRRKAQLLRPELDDDSAHVSLVDMAELGRNPARIIPAVLTFAGKHRGQHVCCIGEPIWPGRTAAEMQEATRHEALINLAFRDSPVTLLCPYDSAGLPRSVIADAACTHPAIIKDRQETASVRYLGPPDIPLWCNRALPRPPGHAETLGYGNDLRPVRSFVASKARQAGLTPPRIPDLVLAVSELAANTLSHTDDGGTVQVWRTTREIICQVADTGQITDPLARHRAPSFELPGGKGLWLVNQVCDLVQARTSHAGTTTRLHMRLHQP